MEKHTPGPWKASGHGNVRTEFVDDVIIVRTGAEGRLADARLIAAAPDLLAALHSFVGYYEQAGIGPCEDGHDDDDDRGPFSGDERYNVREARAAIAKAE